MAFVSRDLAGNITGVFANLQTGFAEDPLSDTDPKVVAFLNSLRPQTVLAQDLIGQFTAADATAIRTALSGAGINPWLVWHSLVSHSGAFVVTDAKFLQIWNGLVTILGQTRMNAIATALGAPSLVV